MAYATGEGGHLHLFLSSCKTFTFGKAYARFKLNSVLFFPIPPAASAITIADVCPLLMCTSEFSTTLTSRGIKSLR